jgi:hypothetical protein
MLSQRSIRLRVRVGSCMRKQTEKRALPPLPTIIGDYNPSRSKQGPLRAAATRALKRLRAGKHCDAVHLGFFYRHGIGFTAYPENTRQR